MKRETIDFYAANKTPVEKLVLIGVNRKDLTETSVIAAAEQLYDEIQGGLKVLPVRVAWEVFSRAKILKGHVEKVELDKTIELQNDFDFLSESFANIHRQYADLLKTTDAKEKEIEDLKNSLRVIECKCADLQRTRDFYEAPWYALFQPSFWKLLSNRRRE